MHPELRGVWKHMRRLGLNALAHANRHSIYMDIENGGWSDLCVLQAAHAAELLIKARIAQEHPLLIFEQIPQPKQSSTTLDMKALFEGGQTLQWSDLPSRLWATTGMRLTDPAQFKSFGRLRNAIQHFAPSEGGGASETISFIYSVIDPFINQCWGLYAIDYDEDYDPYIYLVGALTGSETPFLVSPAAARRSAEWDVDWKAMSTEYRTELERRIAAAMNLPQSEDDQDDSGEEP